jgi:hypothetical protein
MMNKSLTLISALALLLAGCADTPKDAVQKSTEKATAAQPVTGQSALFKIYQVARTWAPDVEIVRMNSIPMSEVPEAPGKSGAWEVLLSSESKGLRKSYTYSVVESVGNLHEGVFGGAQEPAGQGGPKTAPFLIGGVKVDTDAAYNTAKPKAADYEKKAPSKRISFLLEMNTKYSNPTWRVIWGDSVGTSGFSVLIDATTGEYVATLH